MKKVGLTRVIILGLIPGIIAGVAINNMAAAETAKSYTADISIFTTVFLRMVGTIIAPLVVSILVVGIAKMSDAKTLGRMFSKAFFLFICASLVSIALGLVIVNIFQPGVSINFIPRSVGVVTAARSEPFTLKVFISHAVPTSIVDTMTCNEILQTVVFSISLGCSLAAIGGKTDPTVKVLDSLVYIMLRLTGYIMLSAPPIVFATISGLTAKRGLGVMVSAGIFMGEFYLTLGMLWAILIGLSTMIAGLCIACLTKSTLEPALLTSTTLNSEAAFSGTLDKLEKFGVSSKIASFALPISYSFNLVDSMAYCSFTTVFIAQTYNIELNMGEQITMPLVLMLTSKGMVGVPHASMVVIAATLNQFNIPEAGLILLVGVDPSLDMGCSATNVVSSAMGAAIVNRWEGEHFGQGCRGSAPVKSPEQERPATETEVVLS